MARHLVLLTTVLGTATILATAGSLSAAPVTSEVRIGSQTFPYHTGPCVRRSGYVTVKFAPTGRRAASARPASFRLTVGRLPRSGARGGYAGAVLSAIETGRTFAIGHAHVTPAGGATRVTFTAQLIRSTDTVAGSFAC